jgi:hypothetical protein
VQILMNPSSRSRRGVSLSHVTAVDRSRRIVRLLKSVTYKKGSLTGLFNTKHPTLTFSLDSYSRVSPSICTEPQSSVFFSASQVPSQSWRYPLWQRFVPRPATYPDDSLPMDKPTSVVIMDAAIVLGSWALALVSCHGSSTELVLLILLTRLSQLCYLRHCTVF